MRTRLLAATAIVALTTISVNAEEQYPATLEGHAVLPAATFIKPPADAPPSLASAAKYTTPDGHRTDALGTVPGMDGVRPTGLSMPFDGQAVQGLSGIKKMADGTFWTLSDNGFGSKLNSPDAALMLHHLRIDWSNGTVERIETIFLTDPDKKVWFPIVHEGTTERYLTGADFDIESIQPVADGFWIGDELGPFLIKVDKAGKVVTVVDTVVDGKPVKSPDHPTLALPANPTAKLPAFNVGRSKGFEGLAQSTGRHQALRPSRRRRSTRTTAPRRWSTGTRRSAFSNSTSPSRPGPAAAGSIPSPTAALRSATST